MAPYKTKLETFEVYSIMCTGFCMLTFKVYCIFKNIINSSYPRLFCQHGIHVLVWNGWHHLDIWVIPLHPFFVHWNVLCIKQLGTWWVLTCWLQANIYIIILDAAATRKLQVILKKINTCCKRKSYPIYDLTWNRNPWRFVQRQKGRNPLYWTCGYQIQNSDSLLS
jgi:hypothetical protein